LHIYERSQHITLFDPLSKSLLEDFAPFNAIVDEFVTQAHAELGEEGYDRDEVKLAVELDVRSGNQLYVTTIKSPVLRLESRDDLAAVLQAYFAEYSDRFGEFAVTREVGVSVETVRLRASVQQSHWELHQRSVPTHGVMEAVKSERAVVWPTAGGSAPGTSRSGVLTPVFDQTRIGPGHDVAGPAILEGPDTTVAVYPGWGARMDEYGFLTLTKETRT
jgi:N-methylhydantoinase A